MWSSQNRLPDKWFYFPIIGLALCLILKIVQTGIKTAYYPFSVTGDLENRLLYLFFLKEYGFHQTIPDLYHHIILFKDYPPGWYYFTLPFYIFTQNLIVSPFLSLLVILALGFLFIYFFNKGITPVKRIAFFLFFFANLQMLDYLEIVRYPEMLGWVIFIPLVYYTILYKNRKLDLKYFLVTAFLCSVLILTHIYVAILSFILVFSLFFAKGYKEKFVVVLTVLTSFLVTSFWWLPFLDFIKGIEKVVGDMSRELLNLSSIISYNTIFMLGFFIIAFLYIKQMRNKDDKTSIRFLIPSLAFGFLVLTRLIVFIPVFNKIPVTPYNIYFLFLSIYLFFQIDFSDAILKKIIYISLILFTLTSLIVFFYHTTPFIPPRNELKSEIFSFFPIIKDNFFIFSPNNERFSAHYAKIWYNLSSPNIMHWSTVEERNLNKMFKEENCSALGGLVKDSSLKNLISYDKGCDTLKICGFIEKSKMERACLYTPK